VCVCVRVSLQSGKTATLCTYKG